MKIEYSTFCETGRRLENQDHIQVFVERIMTEQPLFSAMAWAGMLTEATLQG